MSAPALLTVEQFGTALGYSRERINQLIADGTIVPAGRFGTAWAIPATEVARVRALLDARTETRGRPRRTDRAGGEEDRTLPGFTRWLLRQAERPDPVGDLARDAAQDADWPRNTRRRERLEAYLRGRGADEAALVALAGAWREYAATQRAVATAPPEGGAPIELQVLVTFAEEEAAALALLAAIAGVALPELVRETVRAALFPPEDAPPHN